MKKSVFLLFYSIIFEITGALGQFVISSGTRWVSDPSTQVVLNDLNFQYDGSAGSLGSRFIFRGTTNSTIGGTTTPDFTIVEIDKQGTAMLLLQSNISISQSAEFTNGLFDLNNNNVSLGPGALINGENENRHFTGSSGGYISITVNMNAPSSLNAGNLGAFITSSANLGAVTINRGHQSQTNGLSNGSSLLRYYNIIPSNNSGINATLRLKYLDAELNGLTESSLVMWKSSIPGSWSNIGFSSRDATANYVEKTNINDFSTWTLSTVNNPLPVIGLNLSGTWKNNTSLLTWTTIAEYDNDHFNIERKYPADPDFTQIGFIRSKNPDGNSQTLTAYNYNDALANRNEKVIFYRLKQTDKNGQSVYSNTIAMKPSGIQEFILNAYPTAAVMSSIFVQTGSLNLQKMQVQVFDMTGKLVLNKQTTYESQLIQLPVMSSGNYQLLILSGKLKFSHLFIKL